MGWHGMAWKAQNSWMIIGVEWAAFDETPQHPGPRLHPPLTHLPSPAPFGQSSQCDSSAFERFLLLFLFLFPVSLFRTTHSLTTHYGKSVSSSCHPLLRMLGWHRRSSTAATAQGSVGFCKAWLDLPTPLLHPGSVLRIGRLIFG